MSSSCDFSLLVSKKNDGCNDDFFLITLLQYAVTEFVVRTVSYAPTFFPIDFMAQARSARAIIKIEGKKTRIRNFHYLFLSLWTGGIQQMQSDWFLEQVEFFHPDRHSGRNPSSPGRKSSLLVQCVMRRRTGTIAPFALPLRSIEGFHITSLKFKLENYWSSRDFTCMMCKSSWQLVFILFILLRIDHWFCDRLRLNC